MKAPETVAGATTTPGEEPVPRVSVAVSTRQRADLLPQLIGALEAQTFPRDAFEVVIVDDGSTDDTPRVLAELAAASPLEIRILRRDARGGQAAGRNRAWRASRAPIIAFTDDDCAPTPGWLEAGLKAMGSGATVVVGRTDPHPEQRARWGPFSRTIIVTHADHAGHFPTCNSFYRREDIEAVGGFDESFTGHGGEDVDLGWRVLGRGAREVFAEDALVYHEIFPSSFTGAIRAATRWTEIPRFYRKHPDARHLLPRGIFWKESHARALLAVAGAVLAGALLTTSPFSLLALTLGIPYIRFRTTIDPLRTGPRRRWLLLPAAMLIDLVEVWVMVRGSIRHRTLVL